MADENAVQEGDVAAAEPTAENAAQADGRVRLSLAGVTPEYANFCTLTARQNEVFMSFGKAFVPSSTLQVDSQVVMRMTNIKQLHDAMGRLLEGQPEQ